MNDGKKLKKQKEMFLKWLIREGEFNNFKRIYKRYKTIPFDSYLKNNIFTFWIDGLRFENKKVMYDDDLNDAIRLKTKFSKFITDKCAKIDKWKSIFAKSVANLFIIAVIITVGTLYISGHTILSLVVIVGCLSALTLIIILFGDKISYWIDDHGIYSNW